MIADLARYEQDGVEVVVAGRLVQISQATMTLEDQTDRRAFGVSIRNPRMNRVRLGDIMECLLIFKDDSWRVQRFNTLVPCMTPQKDHRTWMTRWFKHADQKRKNAVLRGNMLKAFRDYFHGEDFIEVTTPALVACPGMEPHLNGFKTNWKGPHSGWNEERYLPTSPEFHLKKMLVLGYERIFEFCKSFRNMEYSAHHQPEFTMLEWYRSYITYEALMEEVETLICRVHQEAKGGTDLEYRGKVIDLSPPWKRISLRELFLKRFNIHLDRVTSGEQLARAAHASGFDYVKPEESFEVVFNKLFLTEIELSLGWDKPVILYDYPIELAALSRKKPGATRYAERFEVYIGGVELANAFGELNNVIEQAKRFEDFIKESEEERGFHYDIDREFIEALKFGMPPAAGIALGFDRLAMVFADEKSLDNVVVFPHQSPLEDEVNE